MGEEGGLHHVLWTLGPLEVSVSVATTWLVMAVLVGLSGLTGLRFREPPGRVQVIVEALVLAIEDTVRGLVPNATAAVLPFVATLWLFLVPANLAGLIPGLDSPTADLSVTTALALLVFGSVHWFGLRAQGPRRYFRHYLEPSPVLLPLHVIGEFTRTLALAVRLFGNIMSMETAALIILLVAGFLAPVPILMLHIVEALVQAYIFGMLALIFIASGITSNSQNPVSRSTP